MNILIINGSPRINGTTSTIANAFGTAATSNGNEVRTHILNDMRDIRGCQSCAKCFEAGHCVLKDDFTKVLEDHHWADVIVWATPVYLDDMSGILKLFADRMLFSNVKPEFYADFENPVYGRFAPGKKFVLIQTQAAPAGTYKALFDKCTIIMRDTGIHDCHWLECTQLWIQPEAIPGHDQRMIDYEQLAQDLATDICGQK
ncbi:flavodoxin family protein [Pseudodesulfovibrio sp. zrk46]|uniref:flavodoxin family protein n=1 Tax=Pseudodesulfovibrio sp. zrk46 TaxID=2725288 RepID=UPI00144A060D|nr:flavodoxin family protein [Pseudodesulfovibrio sp. zrk46]QJB56841.1 flavodoxin family protein [Pseudodesulfovibrio sp. zrk46]